VLLPVSEALTDVKILGVSSSDDSETLNHVYSGNWSCSITDGIMACDFDKLNDWTIKMVGYTDTGMTRVSAAILLDSGAPYCGPTSTITGTECKNTTPTPPATPPPGSGTTGGTSQTIPILTGGGTETGTGAGANATSNVNVVLNKDGCPVMAEMMGFKCAKPETSINESIKSDESKAIDTTGGTDVKTAAEGGCSLHPGATPTNAAWLSFLLPFLCMCGALVIFRPRRTTAPSPSPTKGITDTPRLLRKLSPGPKNVVVWSRDEIVIH
jgi:hypothetical protein